MWLSHVCFSSAKAFTWDLNHKMTKKCPSNNKKLISKDFETLCIWYILGTEFRTGVILLNFAFLNS